MKVITKGYQKAWAFVLALCLVFTLLVTNFGNLAGLKTEAAIGESAQLSINGAIPYAGYQTARMEVGGVPAYCAEPTKATPAAGSYTKANLTPYSQYGAENATRWIRAAIYYSYGAPGFNASYYPSTWYDGTPMNADRYKVVTHILVSDYYTGNWNDATSGTTQEFKDWYLNEVDGKMGWNSGAVPSNFEVYQMSTGSGTQVIISYTATGFARLQKSSSRPDITNGNPCYSLAGAVYGVYSGNTEVGRLTTTASGSTNTLELAPGTYSVREISPSPGYTLDTNTHTVTVATGQTATLNVTEIPADDPIFMLVRKVDKETGSAYPMGAASLENAEFTVKYYSNHYGSINDLNGVTPTRTWVFFTDEDGYSYFDDDHFVTGDPFYRDIFGDPTLPLGTITVQETKAPNGYLIDETVIMHTIDTDFNGNVTTVFNPPEVPEQVVRGDVQIVKYGESNDEQGGQHDHKGPLKDVVFTLTSHTTGDVFTITTDENGYATTATLSPDGQLGGLPFDTYTVEETVNPYGYDKVAPFEVTVDEHDKTYYYILRNDTIDSLVQIMKLDESTGKVIPVAGTTFQILDKDKNVMEFVVSYYPSKLVLDEFETDENGMFILPEKLEQINGPYYLKEIKAPGGYLLNDELLEFNVTAEGVGDEAIVVPFSDKNVMGRLRLEKYDDQTDEPIEGAEFTITAAEDIITPDGTKRADEGEIVDILTTDVDGKAESVDLFLGKYLVEETEQVEGYARHLEPYEFELEYEDQHTPIVYYDLELTNKPTEVVIVKQEMRENENSPLRFLGGVTYKFWNVEDEAVVLDENGDPVFDQDGNEIMEPENFELYETDEFGNIFIKYLKPGSYRYQEQATLLGYILDDTVYEFEVDADGYINQKPMEVFQRENDYTKVEVLKKDLRDFEPLVGAQLEIRDMDGIVIHRWTSGETEMRLNYLEPGDYVLVEIEPPYGYELAEDIPFTVEAVGDVHEIVMFDELIPGTIRTSMPNNTGSGGAVRTGDMILWMVIAGSAMLGALVLAIYIIRKKRSVRNEK